MIALPAVEGGFRVISADPPWSFKVRGKNGDGRSPEYPVMSLADIKALPRG